MGRSEEAIEELLETASLQLEEMDAEGATISLETVLEQDPGNDRATQILEELRGAVDRRSPLEVNAAQKFGDTQDEPAQLEELGPAEFETTVDGTDAYDDGSKELLVQPTSHPAPPRKVSPADQTVVGAPIPISDPAASASIEDALEEAEFFASRGMVSDAIAIIEEQLRAFPRHPLLNEKIEELRALEVGDSPASSQASGARAVTASSDALDIETSLDALESLVEESETGGLQLDETGQVDVEEVFKMFKEGVSKQISVDDAQARYDLGLAYKEMGLREDAIREFGYAAKDPTRTATCESMVGSLYAEEGNLAAATDAYKRGLDATNRTTEQELVLVYDLGTVYESRKMFREALQAFLRAQKIDGRFRDVEERVRRLSRVGESLRPARNAMLGGDDELDDAFDKLMNK